MMKTMTTIAAAAAFAMTSTIAFAATNADNTYWSTPDNMDPSVYDMMINPDTKEMRDDDDFAQRMGTATEEEKTKFKDACTEWQKDEVLFTDNVAARCKM